MTYVFNLTLQKATEVLFKRDLLKTTGEIKEKYTADGDDEARFREYQLQVLLQLELESLLVVTARTEDDQTLTVEQVTTSAELLKLGTSKEYLMFEDKSIICNFRYIYCKYVCYLSTAQVVAF